MQSHTEEIAAAHRRAERIHAMRNGEEIPNPETAVADARSGSADDRAVVAMLAGKKRREEIELLRAARGGKAVAPSDAERGLFIANEGGVLVCYLNASKTEMLACSAPFVTTFR